MSIVTFDSSFLNQKCSVYDDEGQPIGELIKIKDCGIYFYCEGDQLVSAQLRAIADKLDELNKEPTQ